MRTRAFVLTLVVLAAPPLRGPMAQEFIPAAGKSRDTSAVALPKREKLSAAERARRKPDYITAAHVQETRDWLVQGRFTGTSMTLSADDQTAYILVRRTAPSKIETHDRWDDVIIVREGGGVLTIGEQQVGGDPVAPGERRDGTIVKPQQIVLRPGDIVRVPAAVPHKFDVDTKTPLEYLLIKVRKPRLPLR